MERSAATSQELCGCWVKVGGYKTICKRPVDHDGECLPNRSDLMDEGERLEEAAREIWQAVTDLDKRRAWSNV